MYCRNIIEDNNTAVLLLNLIEIPNKIIVVKNWARN